MKPVLTEGRRGDPSPGASEDAGGAALFTIGYDGGFEGFLCAVAEALNASRSGLPLPSISCPAARAELFDETIAIPADAARARRLWERLAARAGAQALLTCREAFCSDFAAKEDPLARALVRMYREGASALKDLVDPDICFVEKAAFRAQAQAHLIAGLLRFAELEDGSWYAPIEPDCDVLPLIGDHFAARYADMSFAIHDTRRGKALLHSPGRPWRVIEGFRLIPGEKGKDEGADAPSFPYSEGELAIRSGWVRYFNAVAIAQRENPRLQAGRMPRKYWHLLPEMRSPDAP
ncbi:MAG: TIGR03915 family putative DNA repair protein [Spirochaetales bacterium]